MIYDGTVRKTKEEICEWRELNINGLSRFEKLKAPANEDALYDLLCFLQELCNLAKNLQIPQQKDFYKYVHILLLSPMILVLTFHTIELLPNMEYLMFLKPIYLILLYGWD